MDFIIDAITEWIKDFLIEAITGNLSNMFGDVNTKVATIAGEVGKTPEQWNSGVFSMIHSLSESVIVPIAGLVIAAVLSYELIRMVIDRNNMHDFDTFIFFKWIIKAGIAAYVVSHTFDFIIAIFEVAQTMVQQSAGVIDANASIDISSALASITTELEAKGLGELFALMLETWVVSFAMTVMGALITIIKHKKDGTKYKDFYYYGCKHRTMTRGHKCDYRKQINEELLDDAVAEIIVALVSKPKFAAMMQEKINMKVDTSTIDQEVANHEKQLRQYYSTKSKLMDEIDSLDPDDRHYIKRKVDLDDRLYRMYDKIEEEENLLVEARAKKQAIEAEKLTADNIYKVLIYFEKLYGVMNDVERRRFIEALISEIQIFPERQPNGQWLKSIKFKLPIIGENMELSLDNDKHVECVLLMSKVQ